MNILVIDDEAPALNSMKRRLGAILPDAAVTYCLSAQEGLAYAGQRLPDVAFLDIEMPGMTGLELALRLKEIKRDINIVFVSGYSSYAIEAMKQYPSGYLQKPVSDADIVSALEHLRHPVLPPDDHRVRVQCFGNFEVFADGAPIQFPRSKSKELFAYLIDRRGAGATSAEINGVLWETRDNTKSLRSQAQNVIASMRHAFDEVGQSDVIIKGWNSIAVDVSRVECDYYNMLNGDVDALNSYTGEYMINYSWAEPTGSVLYLRTIK